MEICAKCKREFEPIIELPKEFLGIKLPQYCPDCVLKELGGFLKGLGEYLISR